MIIWIIWLNVVKQICESKGSTQNLFTLICSLHVLLVHLCYLQAKMLPVDVG